MRRSFTILLLLVLGFTMINAQILDYGPGWDTASDITIIGDAKTAIYYVQFRDDQISSTTGYVVFPVKDLSGYGDKLTATIQVSVKAVGEWTTGRFELLITDDYKGDVNTTSWTTLNDNLAKGIVNWNDDWAIRNDVIVSFDNPKSSAAVLAIRAVSNNTESTIASRVYEVSLADQVVMSIQGEEDFDLLVYPNPANDWIEVKGVPFNSLITIYDLTGAKVIKQTVLTQNRINIEHLKPGYYLLSVEGKEGVQVEKFMKK